MRRRCLNSKQYLLNSLTLDHSIPSACFYLQGPDDGGLPLFLVRCGGNVEGQVKRNEDIFFHHGIFEKDGAFWWTSVLRTSYCCVCDAINSLRWQYRISNWKWS